MKADRIPWSIMEQDTSSSGLHPHMYRIKKSGRGNCTCHLYSSLRMMQSHWMIRRYYAILFCTRHLLSQGDQDVYCSLHPLARSCTHPICCPKETQDTSCSLQVVGHHCRHSLTVCSHQDLAGDNLLQSQPCAEKVLCQAVPT